MDMDHDQHRVAGRCMPANHPVGKWPGAGVRLPAVLVLV